LTLFAEEAEQLGIVTLADNFDAFLSSAGIAPQQLYEQDMTFNQEILRFLGINPWVFFLLTLIGLNGLYVELKAPGFGIPGFTALVCFVLVFGSRYFLGTADVIEMAVFVIGILLCLLEIFVLPGVGIAGISGLALLLGSLVLASLPDFGNMPNYQYQEWMTELVVLILAAFLGSLATVAFLVPVLFKLPATQRRLLPNEFRAEDGYVVKTVENEDQLIGQQGLSQGDLRPSGKVLLDDGRFLDVVSDGMFIANQQRVKIHKVDGNRIIVRPLPAAKEE
jgi:membrane-bound serine protease (ClpP class)